MEANRDWADVTAQGLRAMASADYKKAAACWEDALALLARPDGPDPRLAASQSNAGVGCILVGRADDGYALFCEAERTWSLLPPLIAMLDVSLPGTSSLFHFHLASRNLPAFQNRRRKRYAELCAASLAITRFNRLLATEPRPDDELVEPAARELADDLSATLGARAPEVGLLSFRAAYAGESVSPSLLYAEKAALLSQISTPDSEADICSRFEAAFARTVLLAPALVSRDASPGIAGEGPSAFHHRWSRAVEK